MEMAFDRGDLMYSDRTRRSFLHTLGVGATALGIPASVRAGEKVIQGFEKEALDSRIKIVKP